MSYILVFNILAIASFIAAAVLFFIGLKVMVNYMKKEGDEAVSLKNKSIRFLAIACACYALGKFCTNFVPMSNSDYNVAEILLQSVVEAVIQTGFLILLPVVIKGRRKKGGR
ncbi:MAG: hypothetical protein K5930_03300 [Treponemataceae bacterium]|nr:hypothetical protein [Treponemataceae bacterium]